MIPFGRKYSDRLEPQTGSGTQSMEAAGIEPANRADRLLRLVARFALGAGLVWVLLEAVAILVLAIVWAYS